MSWRRSAAGFGRQSRGLPADDATGKVLVIGKAHRLGRQRRRHRALARTAGENHLLALRPEWPQDRSSGAERPHRPDRPPPRPHWVRGHRPEDSALPLSPWKRLPASNRAPDGPPRNILLTTRREGSDGPRQAGAKVAPRGAKIKRRERFKRRQNPAAPNALVLLPPVFSGQKFFRNGPGPFGRLRTGRPV